MSRPSPANPAAGARIAVIAHPPEHRRSRNPVIMNCGCSCCCCCLHSVGGVVGAIVGLALANRSAVTGPPPHIGALYWIVFQVINGLIFLLGKQDVEGAILVVLLMLPGIQLLTSLACAIVFAFTKDQRGPRLQKLGKVTLWAFVGSLAGLGLMVGLGALFGALR